ncbi:MAG: hypothetical protein AAF353_01505 [Pseudomonadota bacterium]
MSLQNFLGLRFDGVAEAAKCSSATIRLANKVSQWLAACLCLLLSALPVDRLLAGVLATDPLYEWHLYTGGSGGTSSVATVRIASDAAGNVYVYGYSYENWGTPIVSHTGGNQIDVFVAKFDQDGLLQWHTFLGSGQNDTGVEMVLDDSGNIYIVGQSRATWGSPLAAFPGRNTGFIAKLNTSGQRQWNTFVPIPNSLGASAITHSVDIDSDGNVIVAGQSSVSWGSPIAAHNGGNDGYAAKYSSAGAVIWNTFFGSTSVSVGVDEMIVDSDDNVIVTGSSDNPWGSSPINAHAGAGIFNAFAIKFNTSGAQQWHTFMGTTTGGTFGLTLGRSVEVDSNDNVFIVGQSSNWGIPLNANAGIFDAFIAKLNPSGVAQWHTFAGGGGSDLANGIVINDLNEIFISGHSGTSNWGNIVDSGAEGSGGFIAKFSSAGGLSWNVFDEKAESLALVNHVDLYTVGGALNDWGTPLNAHEAPGTVLNGFVTKHCLSCYRVDTSVLSGNGQFVPETQVVDAGATANLVVRGDAGYELDTISGCDVTLDNGDIYVTSPVFANCTVEASFVQSDSFIVIPLINGRAVIIVL